MNQIVIKTGRSTVDLWVARLSELLPKYQILPYRSSLIRPQDVRYIIGWRPDAIWVNSFPELKALVSTASGVDHIANLSQLRADILVMRTVSLDLIQKMKEYVAMCLLSWHRQLLPMLEANQSRRWDIFDTPLASELTVGIMGFGGMGKAVSELLSIIGYRVRVWSKSPRNDTPYHYFNGKDSLHSFATGCDVLVCLLPITNETNGILNYELFQFMNKGGCLINAARGRHLVEDDLDRAIKEKLLSYAFLDVLVQEPLPPTASVWDIPHVVITYHCAAYINSDVGSKIIAQNILAFDQGCYDGPIYNPALGY